MPNWIRKVELYIYLQMENGGKKVLSSKKYESDGGNTTIGISFSVSKTLTSAPNNSTVVLYNSSPMSDNLIVSKSDKIAVELYAGYGEFGTNPLLSKGDLIKAFPERNGTDTTLTLTFLDGATAILAGTNYQMFKPEQDLNQTVFEIAQEFKKRGVEVSMDNIKLQGKLGKRGLSISGRTATILDNLATSYGFTWSVQNGVFQAHQDSEAVSQKKYEISLQKLNLLKATPEIGDKYQNLTGMKINAMLDAKVLPGDTVFLDSWVYPRFSGEYVVHNIEYKGSTIDSNWYMEIDSKTIVENQEANRLEPNTVGFEEVEK